MNITELKQRFVSIRPLKRGGQKNVLKAESADGSVYALKLIPSANDPRVLLEIQILQGLSIENIPHIVENDSVLDETIGDELLYIIEDFIDGVSLRDWLNAGNKADLSFAVRLLDTLLSIEVELEKNGILHRDINPNNIMIANNGDILLIDFGLAKDLNGPSLTQTAALQGPHTPGYAPNEQFMNQKMLQDVRTDLFQIGVTVYETCTGTNPFIRDADSLYQVYSRTMTEVPPTLRMKGDNMGMFAQLINILMAKQQSKRPDSAVQAYKYLTIVKQNIDLGV